MNRSGAIEGARIVLDASAYSQMRAEEPAAVAYLGQAQSVVIPATVLGELYGAFAAGTKRLQNLAVLDEFLAEPFVAVWPVTPETARRYGEIYHQLRRAGTPIPTNDMWIAAAAFECDGVLLTFDGDFERIDGLRAVILSP